MINDNALDCSQQVFCFCAIASEHLSQRVRWTILEHPPYSPDLAPSDFHLFPALQNHLSGHKYESDDDVKSQGTEFYDAGFNKLVPQLDKRLNLGGDYVEK